MYYAVKGPKQVKIPQKLISAYAQMGYQCTPIGPAAPKQEPPPRKTKKPQEEKAP